MVKANSSWRMRTVMKPRGRGRTCAREIAMASLSEGSSWDQSWELKRLDCRELGLELAWLWSMQAEERQASPRKMEGSSSGHYVYRAKKKAAQHEQISTMSYCMQSFMVSSKIVLGFSRQR